MTATGRVAVAQRNRSRHAAVVAVTAPEHVAKEAQKPEPDGEGLDAGAGARRAARKRTGVPLLKRRPVPLRPRRETEPEAEPMTTTDRVAVAQRNRSQHAAVTAVTAPEHAAKEARKPEPDGEGLDAGAGARELPESGQECCS